MLIPAGGCCISPKAFYSQFEALTGLICFARGAKELPRDSHLLSIALPIFIHLKSQLASRLQAIGDNLLSFVSAEIGILDINHWTLLIGVIVGIYVDWDIPVGEDAKLNAIRFPSFTGASLRVNVIEHRGFILEAEGEIEILVIVHSCHANGMGIKEG